MLTARVSAIQAITNRNAHNLRKIFAVSNTYEQANGAMSAELCALLLDLARRFDTPRDSLSALLDAALEAIHV